MLESPPLYDVVRDVNKLSNNVMARQVFLTLATTAAPLPATPEKAADAVQRWLAQRKLAMPGFAIENGSGLSRVERMTAGGLARLLAAADASAVRDEFATSLAVAATDGTLERRMTQAHAAGRALLKTGSLEGVRALAGYVIDASGTRWILVAFVNHPNAARAPRRRSTTSPSGCSARRARTRAGGADGRCSTSSPSSASRPRSPQASSTTCPARASRWHSTTTRSCPRSFASRIAS